MNYLLKKEVRTDNGVKKARAYVSSNLVDLADKWFMDRKIYNLEFKSKAWNSVSRKVNKMINEVIVSNLEEVSKSTYNKNAGCQCGCSPGYVLDGPTYRSYDLDIEFGSNTLDVLEEYLGYADYILSEEVLKYEEEKTAELVA